MAIFAISTFASTEKKASCQHKVRSLVGCYMGNFVEINSFIQNVHS